MVDRTAFWDRKILQWERDKYESTSLRAFFNRSVHARLDLAAGLLAQLAPGASVVELGCGSARLLPVLEKCQPASYVGVDISGEAIEEARRLADRLELGFPVTFVQAGVEEIEAQQADLCFSLGLLDWLSLEDVELMLKRVTCQHFFHTYSERRNSPTQQLHRLYAYLMYGHKTGSYVPQYMEWRGVENAVRRATGVSPRCHRSRALSFGTLVHNLPERIFEGGQRGA
jgi:ubiquinone/menaquinone biosynthesis C-methylase UbiE